MKYMALQSRPATSAAVIFLMLFLAPVTAQAHEILHTINTANAVVLQLSYANGKPFKNEAYELYANEQAAPMQVGRTNAQGQVIILSDGTKKWRVRAFSAHGHGVNITFEAPALVSPATSEIPRLTAPPDTSKMPPNRSSLILFGLSLLLAGFGLYQLFLPKKIS